MSESKELLKQMGQRIFERRKSLGLTQEQLAEQMDVTAQMISYVESGKKAIRPENLLKLSRCLGVSSDYLLTGEYSSCDISRIYDKLKEVESDKLCSIEGVIDLCIKISK